MRKNIIYSLVIAVLINSISLAAFGAGTDKSLQRQGSQSSVSEYVFESFPNQVLIPVRLLGEVKKAGLYYVPENFKLVTLLTIAGGTTADANLETILISNDLKKAKDVYGNDLSSFEINLSETLREGARKDYELKANDIVFIDANKPFISSDSFRIISVLSLLLTSALTALAVKDKL